MSKESTPIQLKAEPDAERAHAMALAGNELRTAAAQTREESRHEEIEEDPDGDYAPGDYEDERASQVEEQAGRKFDGERRAAERVIGAKPKAAPDEFLSTGGDAVQHGELGDDDYS